mmetsp:Transcript_6432/g.5794  ORF Transcript_6432/g.5794 Transcript_6432/m.5794 type:complete len:144 (-) Transcript_6432:309-740(-)
MVTIDKGESSKISSISIGSIDYGTHVDKKDDLFTDLVILKKLNQGNSPIYLTISPLNHQHYAMKVFTFQNGQINPSYQSEIRASELVHEHVIKMHHFEQKRDFIVDKETQKVSIIMMEYAPFDDFSKSIARVKFDDKMIRTYF